MSSFLSAPTAPHLPHPYWPVITRFGEAQILLPALLVLLVWFFFIKPHGRRTATVWMTCVSAAALLTTLTKLAFIGWGVGWARFNFTGISGHAMFAAAIIPLLMAAAFSTQNPRMRRVAVGLGCGLALIVAVSRVTTGAHSISESVAGFLVGTLASGVALTLAQAPPVKVPRLMLAGLCGCLALLLLGTPTAPTHALVTRLALRLSGNEQPYTRAMMLSRHQLQSRQRMLLERTAPPRPPAGSSDRPSSP